MLKLALKYGLIAAAIMIAVIIVPFYWQDQDPAALSERMKLGEIVGFLTMALAMALVYFALREQRSRLGGRLGFWQGVLTGAATTMVAATVFGLATTLLYVAMGPERTYEFMQLYIQYSAGADEMARAQALAEFEANRGLWLSPWFNGALMFATVVPIGLLLTLISAWWLRSDGAQRSEPAG